MALLVSSAMVLGSISSSVSAQSNAAQGDPAQLNVLKQDQATADKPAPDKAKNVSPLAPGGAAGIQNAQGNNDDGRRELFLVGGGILAAGLILLLVAGGGGGGHSTPTTGTH